MLGDTFIQVLRVCELYEREIYNATIGIELRADAGCPIARILGTVVLVHDEAQRDRIR